MDLIFVLRLFIGEFHAKWKCKSSTLCRSKGRALKIVNIARRSGLIILKLKNEKINGKFKKVLGRSALREKVQFRFFCMGAAWKHPFRKDFLMFS